MKKTAVYALGGNALQSPAGGSADASQVLAKVMSDESTSSKWIGAL